MVERGVRRLAHSLGINLDDEDVVAVVGTPWIWDLCERSEKYERLMSWIREAKSNGQRLVALGIGSCIRWGEGARSFTYDSSSSIVKEAWGSFDFIACRDWIAKDILMCCGVNSTYLPCPSYFSIGKEEIPSIAPKKLVAIKCDPWHPEHYEADNWIPRGAEFINYKNDFNFKDDNEFLTFFKSLDAEFMVSQRIHAILPFARYRRVRCVPIDSRAMTTQSTSIPIHPNFSFSDPNRINLEIERYRPAWNEALRTAFRK